MKAPINFADRITYQLGRIGTREYQTIVQNGTDNKIWVFPNWNAMNVIMIELNWGSEQYRASVAKSGHGDNFAHTTPWFGFDKRLFTTYNGFKKWLSSQVSTCQSLFDIEI